MTNLVILKFRELSLEKILPMVKETEDIIKYFSDYRESQTIDRKYMFQILITLRFDVINSMIQNTRKNRSIMERKDGQEHILIRKKLLGKIELVFTHKCKPVLIIMYYSNKGKCSILIQAFS